MGFGFRIQGLGLGLQDLWFRVEDSGFQMLGSRSAQPLQNKSFIDASLGVVAKLKKKMRRGNDMQDACQKMARDCKKQDAANIPQTPSWETG